MLFFIKKRKDLSPHADICSVITVCTWRVRVRSVRLRIVHARSCTFLSPPARAQWTSLHMGRERARASLATSFVTISPRARAATKTICARWGHIMTLSLMRCPSHNCSRVHNARKLLPIALLYNTQLPMSSIISN